MSDNPDDDDDAEEAESNKENKQPPPKRRRLLALTTPAPHSLGPKDEAAIETSSELASTYNHAAARQQLRDQRQAFELEKLKLETAKLHHESLKMQLELQRAAMPSIAYLQTKCAAKVRLIDRLAVMRVTYIIPIQSLMMLYGVCSPS